jgi:hypothetical protein
MPCPEECQKLINELKQAIVAVVQDAPITVQMPSGTELPLVGPHGGKDFQQAFHDHHRLPGPLYGQAIVTVVRAIDGHTLHPATLVLSWGESATISVSTSDGYSASITLTYSGTRIDYSSSSEGNHGFNVTFIPFTAAGGAALAIP